MQESLLQCERPSNCVQNAKRKMGNVMTSKPTRLPSGKEVLVLELLTAKTEMYGLEMVKSAQGLKRGTIYVLLDRMEDKGLITSRKSEDTGRSGMPRRLYKVTGLGCRALQAYRSTRALLDIEGYGYGSA